MKCCCLWTLYFSHHIINIHSNHFYKYLCTTRLLVYPVWRQNLNCTLPGTRFKGGRELWSRFFGGFSRLMHHMCDHISESELNPNDDMFPHPTSRIVTKLIKSLQKWENWKEDEMIGSCSGTSLDGLRQFGGKNYYFSWLDNARPEVNKSSSILSSLSSSSKSSSF